MPVRVAMCLHLPRTERFPGRWASSIKTGAVLDKQSSHWQEKSDPSNTNLFQGLLKCLLTQLLACPRVGDMRESRAEAALLF